MTVLEFSSLLKDAYVVGGAVRDWLLRKSINDFDILVRSKEEIFRLADRLKVKLFSFKGTYSFYLKGIRFDFNVFSDLYRELERRDFTVNALAVKLPEFGKNSAVLDFFGGKKDLFKGILRPLNPQSLSSDPLRVIRAARFCADYAFEPSDELLLQAESAAFYLSSVAAERILNELKKVELFLPFLRNLIKFKAFFKIFPELKDTLNVKPIGVHRYSLFEHLLKSTMFADSFSHFAEPKLALKIAVLYHDVGKPKTLKKEGTKVTFYGHEKLGAQVALKASKRLRMSNSDTKLVKTVVENHMRPILLFKSEKLGKGAVFRFFKKSFPFVREVLLCALSDFAATSLDFAALNRFERFCLKLNAMYESFCSLEPLLSGDEIKDIRKVSGRQVGFLKDKLLEAQFKGLLKNKEQAVSFIKGVSLEGFGGR